MNTPIADVAADPSPQLAAMQAAERPSFLRRMAAAGLLATIAVSGAGCSLGEDGGASENNPDAAQPQSPDQVTEDVYNITRIQNELMGAGEPDIQKVGRLEKELSPAAQAAFTTIDEGIDLGEASTILKDVEYESKPPERARKQVKNVIDDPKIAQKTLVSIDAVQADDIVEETAYLGLEPTKARAQIKKFIKDKNVRDQALSAIDRIDAEETYQAARYGSAEQLQAARDHINGLKDGAAKSAALAAIDAYIAYDRDYLSYDNLEASLDADQALDTLAFDATTMIDDEVAAANEWSNSIDTEIIKLMKKSRRETRQYIHDANNLKPEKKPDLLLEAYDRPNQAIKLGAVNGVRTNVFAPKDREYSAGSEWANQTMEQFAHVQVQGKGIALEFEDGAKVPSATRKQLQALVDSVGSYLHAGFSNGDIINVRFVLSDDYGPFYVPATHEIFMVLDPSDHLSVDQLRSGLVHEATHALVSSATDLGSNASDAENRLIGRVCTNLRDTALDTMQAQMYGMTDQLAQLEKIAKPDHKILFKTLREAIEKFTLPEAVSSFWEGEEGNTILNECLDAINFENMLTDIGLKDHVYISGSDLEYMFENETYVNLSLEWDEISRAYTIFSKFNEAHYVTTYSIDKEYLGHTEDNFSELTASVIDAALSYPNQFADSIAKMDSDEKAAAIEALGLSIDILVKRHPQLLGPMSKLEAKILTRVHNKS